ncbi:MAG: polysaccharide biosynthesis protein [Candidatus Sumerlaeia bacterium]|nr:polysaccharide biosynthesis protein [Candidatus Sumerlaeia bacterium]
MPWKPKRFALVVVDLVLFSIIWLLAYLLRFVEQGGIPHSPTAAGENYHLQMWLLLPWVVLTHAGLYFAFHVYRGMIRYIGSTELRNLGMACGAHLVLWILINMVLSGQAQFFDLPQRQRMGEDGLVYEVMRIPWGVLVTYAALGFLATAGIRFLPRLYFESSRRGGETEAPATLIAGASDLADTVLRGLARHGGSGDFRPICAVAADPSRVGLRLHGVPVVGTLDHIADIIEQNKIEQVLIALEDQSPAQLRKLISDCENAGVKFHFVPSMSDIADGKVEVSQARHVQIEDLLGREPVRMELPEDRNYIRGNVVLITGAGGSIGSELARQCAIHSPGRLLLLGKGENSIFDITNELRRAHPGLNITPLVGDVRDASRMEILFREYQPQIIFHAAAHKHVPLMEDAHEEAAANNILGTWVMASLAERYGCRSFTLVSSDKAVRPSSVMGATKRYAETVIRSLARESKCCFQAVRFGNVLGSRGSVIPLFREQIRNGGPVTVTHPDMLRYFMTIPEAVALTVQAGARSVNGGLYLLDMGEPVRIADLARNMIALSGFRPDVDIKIEFTGVRPGEKLKEELLTASEECDQTEVEKLFEAAPSPAPDLGEIESAITVLRVLVARCDRAGIRQFLSDRITDYESTSTGEYPTPLSMETPLPTSGDLAPPAEEAPEQEHHTPPTPLGMPTIPFPTEEYPEPPEAPAEDAAGSMIDLAPGETAGPSSPPIDGPDSHTGEEQDKPDNSEVESAPSEEAEEPEVEAPSQQEDQVPEPKAPEPEEQDLFSVSNDEEEPTPEPEEIPAEAPPPPDEVAPPPTPVEDPPDQPFQEDEEPIVTKPKNPQAILILRVSESTEKDTLGLLLQQIESKVLGDGDKLVVAGKADKISGLSAAIPTINTEGKIDGAVTAEALALNPEAGVCITLNSEVLFGEKGIEPLRDAILAGAPLAYSNYLEDKGGETSEVKLHLHNGCPHERFEFGPVIAYNLDMVKEVGGPRADLNYAWEYDLQLKLMEKAPFVRVDEFSYTRFIPVIVDESTGKKVFSPGMGPLGGFSYVFYPEGVEKEVTAVFEEALKRRGAWLDHPTSEVDHTGKNYELLASVVIPILNRVRFIGNAIEKLQKGTFQDFEIVIVDNGSTDGTVEKIKEIAAEDNRVRLIHGKGGSIASALNEGIRAARGKYICQLDSDDEYAPTTLEDMIGHLESHPKCGLCISYYRLMDEDGTIIEDVDPITHGGYTRNQILRRDGAGAVRIFPRAVLEEFGYYDEEHYGNFGEDYDMVVKTGEKYDVDRLHKVLYHYRRHEDNTDVTRDPEMKYHNKNRARQEALKRRIALNKKLGKA